MPKKTKFKSVRPINKRRVVGIVLLVLSVLMLVLAGWLTYSYVTIQAKMQSDKQAVVDKKVTVPTQTVEALPNIVSGTPVKIDIPSVSITQPVKQGSYDASTGQWTLSYHAVYWGDMTAPVNSQTGNTFIYGHDVSEIFGNLLKAQTGAKAIVTTDNGYQFTYTLQSSVAVDPTDTSLLQPTDKPTLTLQTCSGSWYQYRQIFTFSLDGYKKVN